MAKRRLLFKSGKRNYYEAPEAGYLIVNHGESGDHLEILNQRITEHMLGGLSSIGVLNQFVKRLNMHESMIFDYELIPIRIRVRLRADEEQAKTFGGKTGFIYAKPIYEIQFRNGEQKLNITFDDLITLGLVNEFELTEIKELVQRASDYLTGFYWQASALLVEFNAQFGRQYFDEFSTAIILTDELSPKDSVIWDVRAAESGDFTPLDLDILSERIKLPMFAATSAN